MKVATPPGRMVVCFLTIAILALYLMRTRCVRINGTVSAQEECSMHAGRCVQNNIFISNKPAQSDLHNQENNEPKILYLLQTEECLPSHLRRALGDSSACQCDVVVLSYRRSCSDTSLSHVKYLFNSTVTWAAGRNLLFYTNIQNRGDQYLYYIVMDDDVHVKWATKWEKKFKKRDPWRSFEEFLLRVQPALAVLEIYEKFLTDLEEIHKQKNCPIGPEYNPTVRFDAAFNAYHYKAVEYILPYWVLLDNVSWFYPNMLQRMWSEIVFRGHVVVHRRLIAMNAKHRPYPRKAMFESVLPTMLKKVRDRLPKACHNATLLQEYTTIGYRRHLLQSSTYCLPPPAPKQAFSPFSNFDC